MARSNAHSRDSGAWALVGRQHGVVARRQLVGLGLSKSAIEQRLATGRLRLLMRGVYAVGRPEVTQRGRWMAGVLATGSTAVLSHASAAALWGFGGERGGLIEVSVGASFHSRLPGLRVHRRRPMRADEIAVCDGIPVTGVVRTIVDVAAQFEFARLERAVNEADRLDLIDPESLREAIDAYAGERGVGRLRRLLDRLTFRMTDSELEQRFLPIVDAAGLPRPETRYRLNGFLVDFYWPDLGLVVETDGLRYHRTASQQTRDRRRDQAHSAAGMTPLRFTHAQVRFEAPYVRDTLRKVARRLGGGRTAEPF